MRFAAQQQCSIWFTYCQKGATDKTHRRLVQGTCPGTTALAEDPWEMWVELMGKLPFTVSRSLCSEASKNQAREHPWRLCWLFVKSHLSKAIQRNQSLSSCLPHPSLSHPPPAKRGHALFQTPVTKHDQGRLAA